MIDVLTFGEAMVSLRADQPGHRVRWVGLTGNDEFGGLVLRPLRAEGVDTQMAERTEAPTGLIALEPRTADATRISYYRSGSASSSLGPQHMAAALRQLPRVIHATGITAALGPSSLEAVRTAVQRAKGAGVTVSFDVNHRSKLRSGDVAAGALRPLMPYVDLLIASEDELALAAPADTATEAERVEALLGNGVREVVVKCGAHGAEVFDASGSTARPAVPVAVKGSVGAGDAFVAGYLSGLLGGETVEGRLERAVTAGAFAVVSTGRGEGLPERTELDLIRSTPGSAIR
ncbi:sugar kinase [Streptomyces sp. NPDC008343]|uniref:sugar kinase n=1 Tax=Streptomyces sp. NPDC008343 TaxID=3364828 RepID=UPI0036ECE09C